ncbi:MAG: helix-turn-helix transcriptional regulator [Defluviitaleaceae bacterium]|nr:helix-turn-helix transcriptional regulator [Defluviitaleaceae bacterium]
MNLRIRDMREDRDINQDTMAKYLHYDKSGYSKYERGERETPLRLILKITASR